MAGLLGKKIGMTSIFDDAGKNVACTVVEVGPCYVTQVKTEEKDGYSAHSTFDFVTAPGCIPDDWFGVSFLDQYYPYSSWRCSRHDSRPLGCC